MNTLALLFIGFSLFGALTLALTQLRSDAMRGQPLARGAGWVLLGALAALQGAHLAWLQFDLSWIGTPMYRATLFVVAPAFYLFSRTILTPQAPAPSAPRIATHLAPVLLGSLLPAAVAMPLAFTLGAGYLAWLARQLYALRADLANFYLELLLLGGAFGVALGVAVLGVWVEAIPQRLFIHLYASAIGLAFLLVQIALGRRPQLPEEVRETAQAAYAHTTLGRVDCDDALARLEVLMRSERLYADADLSLARLAERLGLSAHQLSELMNTRLGKGYSRYLRERRVEAARRMLLDEPRASVLSVGLSVGFTSQSSFYEAFREIEGSTPGQFRKLQARSSDHGAEPADPPAAPPA